ncbi:MAG TPA: polysaccharide deacetylase family protein [Acidobacteriota bacterium]|nr:polysaccharide deacetylase family protein [Acidobacteriota bacterium]
MKFKKWFSARKPAYIRRRANRLLTRYSTSSSQTMNAIDACVKGLVGQGCAPTFAIPGLVVRRFPQYFRSLQEAGAEIAVHGYQHVDLSAYPVTNACKQLAKAREVINRNGIDVHGFRCPYLGYTDELLDALPKGLFRYSSNKAIHWDGVQGINDGHTNIVLDTLRSLYHPAAFTDQISVPYARSNMYEIPVCLPDDMELMDGLNLPADDVANVWGQILDRTHQRGELFTLLFHSEMASLCEQPFYEVLRRTKLKRPQVWVARLRDISEWWAEKAGFKMEAIPSITGLHLDFICSPRATILLKGIDANGSSEAWDGSYQRLLSRTLEVPASPRPFIGVSNKTPQKVISFLMEQGYILDITEQAPDCGIYLDGNKLASLTNEVQLIDYIEESAGPLVRYWRWPNGAKSAMSITGDLDALSLLDYLSRLYRT